MNDDPTTSSTIVPLSLDSLITDNGATMEREGGDSGTQMEDQQQARSRIQNKKRAEIISDLLRNIDIMIYCELSALYYMDCSTFQFILRALVQFFYLTPKPPLFPEPPKSRPYVGAILGTNTLCALLHIVYARPEAGEAMRGYLHGGLVIDFVGQKGPVSKFWLLMLDLLTLTMQLFMLAAHLQHQNVKAMPNLGAGPSSIVSQDGATTSAQNLDSEERGVLRSGPFDTTDVELRTFTVQELEVREQRASDEAEDDEGEANLDEPPAFVIEDPTDHPLDTFHGGEMVAIDLHLFETICKQYGAFGNSDMTESGSSYAGPSTALARNLFQGRLTMRSGVSGSDLERS
ncbi:MAG: hypothetical protein M1812_002868 [Candelaria pacifica]|nr:MAG: hypothetical protein M1812_002868 [Candelaria pacifica]